MASISEYESMRSDIFSTRFYVVSMKSYMNKTGSSLSEGVIISGKAIDGGKFSEYASQLEKVNADLLSIASYCTTRINQLTEEQKKNVSSRYLETNVYNTPKTSTVSSRYVGNSVYNTPATTKNISNNTANKTVNKPSASHTVSSRYSSKYTPY